MRKNVIALILVIPLLFIFVVFSFTKVAGLGVDIKPTSISILNKPEDDTLLIDLKDPVDYTLEAEVLPLNASNRAYTFVVSEVEGSEFADVRVDERGKVTAHSTGVARITAECKAADVEQKDSITVVVVSSAPYDFEFRLFGLSQEENVLSPAEGGYAASVETGRFRYAVGIKPSTFTDCELAFGEGSAAVLEEQTSSLLLPFSGEEKLTVTVPDGIGGDLVKEVSLTVRRAPTESGILINGGAGGNTVMLAKGSKKASFFVETEGELSFAPENASVEIVPLPGGEGRYRVDVVFGENYPEESEAELAADGRTEKVRFLFSDFEYELRTQNGAERLGDGSFGATMLKGTALTLYAVPAVIAEDVTYRWEVLSGEGTLAPRGDGASCTLSAGKEGEVVLRVRAFRGEEELLAPKTMRVSVIRQISAVQVRKYKEAYGLAGSRYSIAGKRYEGGKLIDNSLLLRLNAYDNTGALVTGLGDLEYTVGDPSLVGAEAEENGVRVTALGKGESTVTIAWKGNEIYGTSARVTLPFNLVGEGVEVKTSPELYSAQREKREIVLGANIMLGTDETGAPLSVEVRRSMLGSMQSTYNTEYYRNIGKLGEAKVSYAFEIVNDIYGNGYTLNAEYFANALDGSRQPQLFKGPLCFVDYGEHLASVAGQDNISFLLRTDGVVLYDLTLLGCSDESLVTGGEGSADLKKLNYVGTTLEVNASASILNCRIRNGRNVVRVYGGNRDGMHYFLDDLKENRGCDGERIVVRIEGCVIAQGEEFLLKLGANRALRATDAAVNDPALLDGNGRPYDRFDNAYLNDEYFYSHYVLTDVTLKDSVLETSGLFCVGVESNFAGPLLNGNTADTLKFTGWAGTGGTSFASILRLRGDVRIYDWKDLDRVDSSTLIETTLSDDLKLNVSAMIDFVCGEYPERYGDVVLLRDGRKYVHGGIAFYGGGRNYSQLSVEGLAAERADLGRYDINIGVLQDSDDETVSHQGSILPLAAGTQDFRFYLYGAGSRNSYAQQLADEAAQAKYRGIAALSPFAG